jgi:hypothetical protein
MLRYLNDVRPLLILLLALAACSGKKPTADEVLQATDAEEAKTPLDARGKSLQATANRKAQAMREAARAQPQDVEAQVAAARALFIAADLELRRGLIASLDQKPPKNVDKLLDREDDLPGELKKRIVALTEEGAEFASAAIALDGKRPDARFYYAACTGLVAWGKGAAAALFQGLAPKVKKALEEAVAADSSFMNGAPLRGLGAFYSRAPWPVGDKKKAKELFSKAGNSALTHLYHAEHCWRTKDRESALRLWKQVETAPLDTVWLSEPFIRELARRALALAAE